MILFKSWLNTMDEEKPFNPLRRKFGLNGLSRKTHYVNSALFYFCSNQTGVNPPDFLCFMRLRIKQYV